MNVVSILGIYDLLVRSSFYVFLFCSFVSLEIFFERSFALFKFRGGFFFLFSEVIGLLCVYMR